MEFNKTCENPMLICGIELIKEKDTPERRETLFKELTEASFIVGGSPDREPVTGDDGELHITEGTNVRFPKLSNPQNQPFVVAFTDKYEFDKWQPKEKLYPFKISFGELAMTVLAKNSKGVGSPALGIVINPFGSDLVLPKESVAKLAGPVLAKMQQEARAKKEEQQ